MKIEELRGALQKVISELSALPTDNSKNKFIEGLRDSLGKLKCPEGGSEVELCAVNLKAQQTFLEDLVSAYLDGKLREFEDDMKVDRDVVTTKGINGMGRTLGELKGWVEKAEAPVKQNQALRQLVGFVTETTEKKIAELKQIIESPFELWLQKRNALKVQTNVLHVNLKDLKTVIAQFKEVETPPDQLKTRLESSEKLKDELSLLLDKFMALFRSDEPVDEVLDQFVKAHDQYVEAVNQAKGKGGISAKLAEAIQESVPAVTALVQSELENLKAEPSGKRTNAVPSVQVLNCYLQENHFSGKSLKQVSAATLKSDATASSCADRKVLRKMGRCTPTFGPRLGGGSQRHASHW